MGDHFLFILCKKQSSIRMGDHFLFKLCKRQSSVEMGDHFLKTGDHFLLNIKQNMKHRSAKNTQYLIRVHFSLSTLDGSDACERKFVENKFSDLTVFKLMTQMELMDKHKLCYTIF